MSVAIYTKVGESRGKTRIWIEGNKLAMAGIEPSMKWAMTTGNRSISIQLFHAEDKLPDNAITGGVSQRTRTKNNGQIVSYPLIEFRRDEIANVFAKDQEIKVCISGKRILITPQKVTEDIAERNHRFMTRIMNNEPLHVGSAFHGGGVLDKSFHAGMADAGINSFVRFAVELEGEYLESSIRNNPELWTKDSLIAQGSIEHIDFFNSKFPKLDIVIAGIPCTGASLAGRAKNKLACAEEHKDAGAMFYYFLNLVTASNAAIVLIENVQAYSSSASMSVIRSVMEARGYSLQERVLGGAEFGAIEDRERLCVVAVSHGLEGFDLDAVLPTKMKESCLGDVMDPVSPDSPMFQDRTYLEEKEKRDKKAGKGFALQVVSESNSTIGTIGKGYARVRSTEPLIQHPENKSFYRLLTVNEHAKVKTIPASIVSGCSDTIAHEILGQSVIYAAFYAVALHLANALKQISSFTAQSWFQPAYKLAS